MGTSGHSSLLKMVSGTVDRRIFYTFFILTIVSICAANGNITDSEETGSVDRNGIKVTSPVIPKSTESSIKYVQERPNLIAQPRKIDNIVTKYYNTKNSTIPGKIFVSTGNNLWDGLIQDCLKKPTFSCIQKNVYTYLDDTLNLGDINVTNSFVFKRNKVDYTKYTKEANERIDDDDEIENSIPDGEARSDTPIEEVTDALYGKGIRFMMTHDVQFKMPDMMFDGATFKISPRSIEGNGALVKIEFLPKTEIEERPSGRILLKKITKLFKNKLLLSFLAIVLIIKIIKIKIMWLLPLIVGVGTAKKLVLKFLLFLFPALSHIFKLCSYYHNTYHQTKYHHHQHQISHLHTIVPQWHEQEHVHTSPPYGAELIYTNPPKGHLSEYLHGASPPHQHHQPDWEFSGPGLGSEYISDIHRNSQASHSFKPKVDDLNEINSWGLGTTNHPPTSNNLNPLHSYVADSRLINPKIQHGGPVYVPGAIQQKRAPAASQIVAQYTNPAIDQQLMREAQRLQAQTHEQLRIQAEQKLISQQQKILQHQPFVQDQQTLIDTGVLDPFYTPILAKIDKIFEALGFTDETCRERLVCSMYKNPNRYSPHSNFVSAELSRDTSELQKPLSTNPSVIRFYRYVQAARDGQDHRDCLRSYSQCNINTER